MKKIYHDDWVDTSTIASYNKCVLASGVQFNVTIGNLCDVSQAELHVYV